MSSGPNLYCSEGEDGSWVDVRGLVYVLGTGGYNRLLRLLGRAGYEIHRSRSSTWVIGKKPCNELIKEINELVKKIMSELVLGWRVPRRLVLWLRGGIYLQCIYYLWP